MATPTPTKSNTLEPPLPFSVDEQSFSTWLAQLDKNDKLETLQALLAALKGLKQATITVKMRYQFLEKISTLVFQLSKQLQETYIKNYFPFSINDTLKVTVSQNCAIEISENYALICKDAGFKGQGTFSTQQKALVLFTGIQAMANVFLYKAFLYEKPGKGFWGLCYLFYLFAKQNEVMSLSPDGKNTCFLKVFKQLLVFEMSNPQQFNTEEINITFSLLNNMVEQIDLLPTVPEKKRSSVPFINLKVDAPPSIAKQNISEQTPYMLYISSVRLIKQLFELSAHRKKLSYNNKVMVLRLIKTLTMNQHRKNGRELADNELFAEIGFDKFIQFLLHKENLSKNKGTISHEIYDLSIDERFDREIANDFAEYRSEKEASLSLAGLTDDKTVEYVDSSDIWPTEKKKPKAKWKAGDEEPEPDVNAMLINQSDLGFCVKLKDKNTAIKVGEVIHLMIHPSSVLTVVRRIISTNNEEVVVGVEVLGYDAELLHLMDIENEGAKLACIIKDTEGVESMIIKANEYQNQEHIFADRDEKIIRYLVEKVFNSSTSAVKHLKVKVS